MAGVQIFVGTTASRRRNKRPVLALCHIRGERRDVRFLRQSGLGSDGSAGSPFGPELTSAPYFAM
jgi:hypothetical protein